MRRFTRTRLGSPHVYGTKEILYKACMYTFMSIFPYFALTACSQHPAPAKLRSAYYWSTTFAVDTAYIARHHIAKLYIRYFDVVKADNGQGMPNATISFRQTPPKTVEVVPVVFIVNDVMRNNVDGLAENIAQRILQMNKTNGIAAAREIQIDCDWTKTTRKAYYGFMEKLRKILNGQGIRLSSTIRLHQLAQTPPPADRGVLMVYNTGDFTDIHNQHPILNYQDVKPYLCYIAGYKLPLSAAYPNFAYHLLFRGKKYVGIVHHDNEYPMLAGDTIIVRQSALEQVLKTKHALEQKRNDINDEIIIFDLKRNNRHDEEIYTH